MAREAGALYKSGRVSFFFQWCFENTSLLHERFRERFLFSPELSHSLRRVIESETLLLQFSHNAFNTFFNLFFQNVRDCS